MKAVAISKSKKELHDELVNTEGWITFGYSMISDVRVIHYLEKGTLLSLCGHIKYNVLNYKMKLKFMLIEESDKLENRYCKECKLRINGYLKFGRVIRMNDIK
jgi:hypothetical protein